MRTSSENRKRDSTRGCHGVTRRSSMPLYKRKNGTPIHDKSCTASRFAQRPGCVTASGMTRRIPCLSPLSFCGTPQGRSAGRTHQTLARPRGSQRAYAISLKGGTPGIRVTRLDPPLTVDAGKHQRFKVRLTNSGYAWTGYIRLTLLYGRKSELPLPWTFLSA